MSLSATQAVSYFITQLPRPIDDDDDENLIQVFIYALNQLQIKHE
jgi:hypothetical protein